MGARQVALERDSAAAVRNAGEAPRVVAVAAGKGGVGTTSVVAGLALTLGALLPGRVALADTRTGTASIGRRVGADSAPHSTAFAGGTVEPARAADVMVVDGAPWDTPLTRPMLVRLMADLREDHLFTLLDVGDDASDIGHGALARSDRLVVVTTNAADAVAATTRTFERLRGIDEASAAAAVVAVTGVRGRDRGTGDRRRAWPVARVVRVPWDPGFHGGGPIDAGRLRRTTRSALLELAAAVSGEHNS